MDGMEKKIKENAPRSLEYFDQLPRLHRDSPEMKQLKQYRSDGLSD
jgi:hypothetical protein